jgi:hypothetical protein
VHLRPNYRGLMGNDNFSITKYANSAKSCQNREELPKYPTAMIKPGPTNRRKYPKDCLQVPSMHLLLTIRECSGDMFGASSEIARNGKLR